MYPEITVQWISGHNPDLIIDKQQVADLTKYKTQNELHNLFISKGFTRGGRVYGADKNDSCTYWASVGECKKNKAYMMKNCEFSCNKIEL
tara:strand:- start:856 stop:1125 length:270 start_codon:yes stop_codon:yes gene_type:complete